MFKNYLKTTYRHLLKSKVNFVFKLSGLTMAFLSFLIIAVYLFYQLSFDIHHDDYTSLYRVNSIRDEDGKLEKYAMVPPAAGPALKAEIPEIRSFARLVEGQMLVRYNGSPMQIGGFVYADPSLFDVFTFTFISGTKNAINTPGTIVLSASVARQIFGNDDPIGKVITFPEKNNQALEVAAIVEDLPVNTHIPIKAVMSFGAFENADSMDNNWQISWDGSVFLYVRLNGQTDVDLLHEKMQGVVRRNIIKHDDGQEKRFSLFLQRIDEIYLSPGFKMEFITKGNALYVYIFSLLGVFLLVIASINFVSLSIADFHNRSKEIGVRKILGAPRKLIAVQISMEALSYCVASLLISIVILYMLFPQVSAILEPNLDFSMLLNPAILFAVFVTVSVIVLFSTIYSIIKVSPNNPIKDLKKAIVFGRELTVGKTLLLIQFSITFFCITCTLIISEQLAFVGIKDLGFDRTNIVTLLMPDEYAPEKAGVLKHELKSLSAVESISFSYYLVTGVPYLRDWYKIESDNSMKQIQLNEIFVDHDFFETMDIEILEGWGFDIANPADFRSAFIVNETAVREFGWVDPTGKRISYGFGETTGEKWEGTVVGVAKDFNTMSLHHKIQPLVIRLPFDEFPGMSLNVKVKGDLKAGLASIQQVYENVLPGYVMDYRIIEDVYNKQYKEENKAMNALQLGTWILVLISAFGIFSLSLFMSMKRMKEFGIRKVLGATLANIAVLHISYFLRIVFVAIIIALPFSYWMIEKWLDSFAYRIEPGVLTFLSVALILVIMILLTAAYSTVKASRMNPIDAIKLE